MSWADLIVLVIAGVAGWDALRGLRRWWHSEAQRQRRAMARADPYIDRLHERARKHPSEAAWDAQFEGDDE